MNDYMELKTQYPEYVSLDQVYRICKIAKRSALYLVQHGTIPAVDTGLKTWRYKIAIDDVITYLQKREKVGSMIPRGAVTSRHGKPQGNRKSFSQIVELGHEWEVCEYFRYIYADYADLLTVWDVVDMTGLNVSTVTKLLQAGEIKAITKHPRYLIPKKHLLEFVVTRRFIESKTNSELFKKILGGFEIWKSAR